MKILLTTGIYPPDQGGPATYSKLLNDLLPAKGILVEVLSFSEVRKLPKIVRHIAYLFKAVSRSKGCDIIFAQDTVSVGLPSLLAAKLIGKKFILRVPGDYAWEQSTQRFGVKDSIDDFQDKHYGIAVETIRFLQKFVVRRADAVIAPSKYFAKLVDGWMGKSNNVTNPIYNGIDFTQIDELVSQDILRNNKMIVSAGRLVPWKGFADLIVLMKSLPEYSLQIAGDGPLRNELQKLIDENYLSNRVKLLGKISRIELLKYKASAFAFVLNTSFESFSFDIVESMAVGTPVISTNIGNLSEIIENEIDGILVNKNSGNEIISAIGRLSKDPVLYQTISDKSKVKARKFSVEATIDSLLIVLKNVICK